mgnify:CR=1 FL=1
MKKLSLDLVEKIAKERGLKMTPQRRAIIRYLQSAKNHPTPEGVLKVINRRFPMASRATVYNTINWLKENGLLKEIFESGIVRLDPNFQHHHHFVCRKCGKVEDVDFEILPDLRICTLPGASSIESFEVVIRGICEKCKDV